MIADKYCASSRFNHIFYKTTILYILYKKTSNLSLKKKNYL